MAAWAPIIKTAIPHIAQIVTVALPMFTSKSENAERDALTTQQIKELQKAATQNAESVRELATQLRNTFESLESAATGLQKELGRQKQLIILALVLSIVGFCISTYVLVSG